MISKIYNLWSHFWFAPVELLPLGILRIVLIGYLFFTLPERFLVLHWSQDMPQEFMVLGLALRYSPIPYPLIDPWIEYFEIALRILGALATLGIFTRISLGFFTIGYWYLAAVDSAWGWHDHGPSLVAQVLLVLCIAPGVSALSIDRFFLNRSSTLRNRLGIGLVGKRWGFQMIFVLLSLFYFTSGFSKLRYGGVQWMNGETLSFYLSGKSVSNRIQQYGSSASVTPDEKWRDGVGLDHYLYGARPSLLAKQIADSKILCAILAIGTIFFEMFFILILLGGPLRDLLLICGAVFHASIYFLMGISFFPWILIELCLVNWCRVFRRQPQL